MLQPFSPQGGASPPTRTRPARAYNPCIEPEGMADEHVQADYCYIQLF
jgi:hypothetical protein